jgi:GT2 family glycosyltransferase
VRGTALIVLAWNQWPQTRRCLDSLFACDLDDAEIIVVDNGSVDATAKGLAAYGDRLRRIHLSENLGFVRGMNAGIAAARPDDDVVLLNNDLVIEQRDWLNRLRDTAYASADAGIVGCRMHGGGAEKRLFHLGGFIEPESLWGQQTESGQQEAEVGQFPRDRRVQGIAFALAYIRRDCLDRIGALDEIFHSYFEDTDYCLRAADAGIASVVSGAVTIAHLQHGSTSEDGGFRERLRTQSRAAFAARWQQRLIERYRGTVHWQGVSRLPHTYAHLTTNLLWRLDARALRMTYSGVQAELFDDSDFRVRLAAERHMPPVPEVAFVCAPGTLHAMPRGRFRVALAMSEWQPPPTDWKRYYNGFDLLVVPDAFQADVLRSVGVTVPIEIVPLGVDREYCHPDVPAQRNPDGDFIFLCVAEELERDAPEQVVAAYRRCFGETDPVQLLVFVRTGNDESAIRRVLEPLAEMKGSARVRVLSGFDFPCFERARLLAASDALVSARRGAGWDPLVGEAIACGRIVVAPAYGSQASLVLEHGHAVALRGVADDPSHPGCRWAEIDSESLQWHLLDVFERRVALLAQAGNRAAHFAEIHNLDATADRLTELFARGGTLKAAGPAPPRHRPIALKRPPTGQLVILGMHRSGTSSVGGLLARMGIWPGEEDRLLRGPDNPRGHYELAELHTACLNRLQAAGGDWKHPPSEKPAAAIDRFRRDAAAVLETLEGQRPWFIKEPRLCLLVRELLPLLTRPLFIHVVRNPLEAAASLQRRDGMQRRQALELWELYTREAFTGSHGWPRLIVDYNALVADPLGQSRELLATLTDFGVSGVHLPTESEIRAWIDPEPRPAPADLGELSPSQRALLAAIGDRSILDCDSPR